MDVMKTGSYSYGNIYDTFNKRYREDGEIDAVKTEINKKQTQSTQDNEKNILAQEMKVEEEKIKMHEMAHMSAGGGLAGSPSFQYKAGPDGKQYIVGGEVSIAIKEGKTPEETIQNMEQVKAAALAPADPSSQDRAVAAKAAAVAMRASQDMANQAKEKIQQGSKVSIYA